MKDLLSGKKNGLLRLGRVALAGIIAVGVIGFGLPGPGAAADEAPNTPLGGQEFEDVPNTHTFAPFINNLYRDAVISGYPCGGPGEPCVPPGNLPYYRPNADVTRAQMSKFVENGRRNIDYAIGEQLNVTNQIAPGLIVSTTTTDGIRVTISAGADGVDTDCTRANQNCYALEASSVTGNRTGYFDGGRGVFIRSDDATYAGVDANSTGATAYAGDFSSSAYRSLGVQKIDGFFAQQVEMSANGPTAIGLRVEGSVSIGGNLTVSGSKTGYVVDVMQNVGDIPLQAGDVVIVVGNSPAVLGDIPVVTIKRASQANDSGVVGVVDQALYVPDDATRAKYLAEQQALREARARRENAEAAAAAQGDGANPAPVEFPTLTINDDMGTIHADTNVTQIAPGAYANVVTLGSYKGVKVDASFGAVKPGDLLTTSPNPGYAMKVTDKAQATGAIIGKALGSLDTGTGLVPVMVTLK